MTLINELVAKHGTKNTLVGEVFNDALRSALEEMLERCARTQCPFCHSIALGDSRFPTSSAVNGKHHVQPEGAVGWELPCEATAIRALAKEGK